MAERRRRAPAVRHAVVTALWLGVLGSAVTARPSGSPQELPHLDQLLPLAASYVARFDAAFANVVAEERYEQTLGNLRGLPTRRRVLVSDFLMVKLPNIDGWLPFRDVFSVDGKSVRTHDGRLVTLLSRPDPLALFQAQAIVAESANYNIGVSRTMNLPVLALQVLRAANRARFEFSNVRADTIDGRPVYRVDFQEHAHPTMITGPGGRDMPIDGTVWIEPDGTVARTEMLVNEAVIRVTVSTTYRPDAEFGVAMPVEMHEEYVERAGRRTNGLATYERFRKFGVETSSQIGEVKK